jgi:hypothetical protein
VRRAAFPQGEVCLQLAGELHTLFTAARFAGVYPTRGLPALGPRRLALVTLSQLAEGLSVRPRPSSPRRRGPPQSAGLADRVRLTGSAVHCVVGPD